MKDNQDPNSNTHPMQRFFQEALQDSLENKLELPPSSKPVQLYLAEMLVRLMHQDAIYSIRDAEGNPVRSVGEMVLEGDIRFRANSFKREREVHRHIGDLMLFWSGIFPEAIKCFLTGVDSRLDPTYQGRSSYEIAGSFDHDPFQSEAPILRELSTNFEAYQYGLSLVRANLPSFGSGFGQNWYGHYSN